MGVGSDCSATGYYIKKYWDNTYRATLLFWFESDSDSLC